MLDYNGKVSLNVILSTSHTKVNIFVIFSGNLCKSTMFYLYLILNNLWNTGF